MKSTGPAQEQEVSEAGEVGTRQTTGKNNAIITIILIAFTLWPVQVKEMLGFPCLYCSSAKRESR